MRMKCASQDQPPTLRRKKMLAPGTAWYYRNFDVYCWRTEVPLGLDLDPVKRSWLERERKPVPIETGQRPDPSSQR